MNEPKRKPLYKLLLKVVVFSLAISLLVYLLNKLGWDNIVEYGKKLGFKSVEVDKGVSKVSVIGLGMRTNSGVAATMFDALAKAEVNIDAISTSEIVISCIVRREDGPRAMQCVHKAFGLDQTATD